MKAGDKLSKKKRAYDINEKSEKLKGDKNFKFYNKYLKKQLEKIKDKKG